MVSNLAARRAMISCPVTGVVAEQNWEGAIFASRYDVEARIGSGASATVYRAKSLADDQLVALKISRPYVMTKSRRAARFFREVQAVQRIDHDGCVRILDWGIEHHCAFIAMELVDGDDLFDVIRLDAPMAVQRALAITIALCEVLQAAHDLGVVHRDLKPRNVILCRTPNEHGRPRVKVLDFGLAKLLRTPVDEEGTLPLELTRPGAVLGTPHYMAPEQVRVQGEIDGRADLYAVSVVLYEMLTARRPLEERNAVRALIALGSAEPTPPTEHIPDLDGELERVILRGLAKLPDERFATASDLAETLRALATRLAEEHGLTRRLTAAEEAAQDDDDAAAATVVRRVDRPPRRPAKTVPQLRTERESDTPDEEPPTRVFATGEGPSAPKMVAKPAARPRAAPRPAEDGPLAPIDDDELAPTAVMSVTRRRRERELETPDGPPRAEPKREWSEAEKGIRAALVTITIAALTAAIGRWLALW